MAFLVDTCVFLWAAQGDGRLSDAASKLMRSRDAKLYVSTASVWEIVIKHGLGKLVLPEPPATYIPRIRQSMEMKSLPIAEADALQLDSVPPIHKDPFDRLLICQSLLLGLPIISPDKLFRHYAVEVVW